LSRSRPQRLRRNNIAMFVSSASPPRISSEIHFANTVPLQNIQ
jgi:hypothetical protein